MSSTVPVKEKNWGVTRPIHVSDTSELHHAGIRADGFSSRHVHADKYNLFAIRFGCPGQDVRPRRWPGALTVTLYVVSVVGGASAWFLFAAVIPGVGG